MRKQYFILSLILSFTLSIGQMWGGTATLTQAEIKAATAQSSYPSSPVTVSSTSGDWSGKMIINTSTGFIQIRKNSANNYCGSPTFSGGVTQVMITTCNNTASGRAFYLRANTETAQPTSGDYGSGSTSSQNGTVTISVTGAPTSFYIYSNGAAYISSITVTYSGGSTLSSIAVSGTPTKTSYYEGQDFDPTGLTVTGTYSDNSKSEITSGITWAYNPSQTLTLNQTSIGVTATVSEIASSEFTVSGLTVTEAPAAVNYEKVTAEPSDWSGEYILVYESSTTAARVWKGADEANNYAEATIAAGVIAAPEGAAVLTIAKVANSNPVAYTIKVGENYIGQTSNSNGLKIQATAINNSISYNSTDKAVDIIASEAHLRYNSASSSYFRYYKSASYSSQKTIQLYKKLEGAAKQDAGLAYAEADATKLVKLGAFTAPELTNPNSLAVTYESDNTAVAEVASDGTVTLHSAGKAVITAKSAEDDTYKAGSASYTIYVTDHAGTEADPYSVADAKIVIDGLGTKESAYVAGMVSSIQTTTLPSDGYITFFISADGGTTGQQLEAYKCKSLNGAAFAALSDVVTGANVVITGTLKKYNSTYEFDQNCRLVSYEAPTTPKQSIANDQANPYTVAQALVYAADGVTYDLDDYVYVRGVVYNVASFNNGAMNIFIRDANAENQFEFFKCAGINDGNTTTPFAALTDVQEGDVVIGYGQLTVYNSVYEFKQGNYLVDLNRPAVAVTSVELASTATVKVGKTINLSASVLPADATDKAIEWSVVSGGANITFDNGAVTGVAEGQAVVRATSHADNTKYAECTITIAAADPTYLYYNYEKVTATSDIEDGEYLIVYEGENVALNGGLETMDAASNTISVEINDGLIVSNTTTDAAAFTIDVTAGTILSASGNYIGVSSNSNGLKQTDKAETYTHTFSIDNEGNAVISAVFSVSTMTMRYNADSGQKRFRYFKNTNNPAIQLYKKVGTNEAPKADPELAYSPTSATITVGGAWSAPTLGYATGFDGLAAVTYASNKEAVATVTEAGVIALAGGTGTAVITATFAGNTNYRSGVATYSITVNEAGDDLSGTWALVTDAEQLAAGKKVVIAFTGVENENLVAKTMGAQNSSNRAAVASSVESVNGTYILTPADGTKVFTLVNAGDGKYAFQATNNNYLYASSNSSNQLKETDVYTNNDNAKWAISFAAGGLATIDAQGSNDRKRMRYNPNNGSPLFACYATDATTGSLVTVYMLQEETPVEPDYEEVDRPGIVANNYYTICMPKNIIAVRGATFWTLDYCNESGTQVYLVEATAPFAAGKPYIFSTSGATLEVAYGDDEETEPVANGALRGTFEELDQEKLDNASTANYGSRIYMIVNNELRQVAGRLGNTLPANRAYVVFDALQVGQPQPAPGRQVRSVPMQGNVATDIDALNTNTSEPRKVLINGQLLILRSGRTYDTTGRQVNNVQR